MYDHCLSSSVRIKALCLEGQNCMIVQQKAIKSGEKNVRSVREFSNDGILLTITVDNVVATQYYKRQLQ